MKNSIYFTIVFPLALLISCSMSKMAGPGGVSDPIFPRTPSIMPLAKGNTWIFSTTWYDTLGKKIYPNMVDLHISINAQYGLADDTTIVLLDWNNSGTKFTGYVYQYEMEERGKGYLLIYRDLYPLEVRGLYVLGEYNDTATRLYPKEQLWLAYPADSGKKWDYQSDPFKDTNIVCSMELMSNHAKFYRLSDSAMTGVSFSDSCYLYKETQYDTVSYYYYDRNIGNLGYVQYVKGLLRKTLLLRSFANTSGRNYPD